MPSERAVHIVATGLDPGHYFAFTIQPLGVFHVFRNISLCKDMKNTITLIAALSLVFPVVPAQETETGTGAAEPLSQEMQPPSRQDREPELYRKNFQFTFMFPPLSTNWVHNSRTVNKFSLNLFAGNAGGVDGAELGGFINTVNYYVRGFQGAGFGNVVGGSQEGAQLAGFFNVNGQQTSGFQGAGFINVAGGDTRGFQGAGFGNVAGETTQGAQLAGFFNVAGVYVSGVQLAGFASVAGNGRVNAQLSGFANVAGQISGAQIAGFINVAGKVSGAQIAGFLNVCDSIQGLPIGFINVVRKNGYRHFDFSISETQYFNFSYRMGIRRFHNIYSIGKPAGPGNRWLLGFGMGGIADIREGFALNIEAMIHQEYWIADPGPGRLIHIDRLNLLNQFRVLFNYTPNNHTDLFIGPTLNVSVAETNPDIGYHPWHRIGPNWAFYQHTSGNAGMTNVRIWVGITGGIRL